MDPAAVTLKPRIIITAGDPAGIGPEIAARAAADSRVTAVCDPVIYGPPDNVRVSPGVLSAEAGRAAYDAIVRAVSDIRAGRAEAMATVEARAQEIRQRLPNEADPEVARRVEPALGIEQPRIPYEPPPPAHCNVGRFVGWLSRSSRQAMRTATPIST